MRIYAAADLHAKARHLALVEEGLRKSQADVLILAGDILQYGRGRDLLRTLGDLPLPVLYVRGNSDPAHAERWAAANRNLHSLHLNPFTRDGLDFVGASGTVPLPFYSLTGWREPHTLRTLTTMLHSRSVLVAHPPPYGCCDRVMGRFPAGSRGLARLIARTAPLAMICGHIHEAAGIGHLGATVVVNCALGAGRRGAVIVVEDGQPVRAEFV